MLTKRLLAVVLALTLVGLAVFGLLQFVKPEPSTTKPVGNTEFKREVIGKSVQGRNIEAYTYGGGKTHLLLVGGVHGGYEWNSVLLAYQFIDYLGATGGAVPENLTVTVIPSANPDGVFKVTGKEGRFIVADVATSSAVLASGRFNAHTVDLNRNFDCKWKPEGVWQGRTVSAGSVAFSEPETEALRNFTERIKPEGVVFWHSQANAVYASQCENGILPVTLDIMNAYAKASGYPAVKTFDAYETTGAADDWLASINVPAVTVELRTHEAVEWERNLSGIKALFEYYAGKTAL